MKVWFDEDLSPTLVAVANQCGVQATCNRDRGMLGYKDNQLRPVVQSEGFVFATDNAADFQPMYERDSIHPGLLVMPAGVGRERQQQLARTVLDWIAHAAAAASESAADYMVNKLVRIDEQETCTAETLPTY
ncbi:MAG TPA: DUF5615 family PIN-like protein [Solirubrobacteraceae bacterium]|nr:DUF5615 family PIN-like protein [Solirubrobacteraceae bacterium]